MRRLLALVAAAAIASAPYLAVPAAITTTVVVTGCAANAHTQVAQGRDLLTRVQRQLRKANEQGILADEVYVKTKPVQESARAALASAKVHADEPDTFKRYMLIFDGLLAQLELSLGDAGGDAP